MGKPVIVPAARAALNAVTLPAIASKANRRVVCTTVIVVARYLSFVADRHDGQHIDVGRLRLGVREICS
jgi:hypothetical protein